MRGRGKKFVGINVGRFCIITSIWKKRLQNIYRNVCRINARLKVGGAIERRLLNCCGFVSGSQKRSVICKLSPNKWVIFPNPIKTLHHLRGTCDVVLRATPERGDYPKGEFASKMQSHTTAIHLAPDFCVTPKLESLQTCNRQDTLNRIICQTKLVQVLQISKWRQIRYQIAPKENALELA